MEFEQYKSAWRKRHVEGHVSRSLQFVRTSAIRDQQRSEELSRVVFCGLFGLLAIGSSFIVMPAGAGRIAAWLFGAALAVDGIAGLVLLSRRFRTPAGSTMLEFISSEQRQVEARLRLERYTQRIILVLAALALVVLFIVPGPGGTRAGALDALQRMAIVTVFLAFAWRRASSRSNEIRRELDGYLKDLETEKRL